MRVNVTCISAAIGYERLQGQVGELEACPLPFLGYLFWPDTERGQVTIEDLTGWKFEGSAAAEASPLRRSREVYDSEAFVEDLDLAINHIRSVVMDHHQLSHRQPHLPPGIPMRDAIGRVCDVLVLRSMVAVYAVELDRVLADARKLLISKNAAYGNSALDPVRVFSTASLKEQLLVRLDDKASRLARGQAAGEDVAADMLGYLLLVVIAEKREREQSP